MTKFFIVDDTNVRHYAKRSDFFPFFEVFGRNTFGQEGDHHCSGSSPNSSPGCIGKQLCALDPYGCSCAAGFMGRDCNSGEFHNLNNLNLNTNLSLYFSV